MYKHLFLSIFFLLPLLQVSAQGNFTSPKAIIKWYPLQPGEFRFGFEKAISEKYSLDLSLGYVKTYYGKGQGFDFYATFPAEGFVLSLEPRRYTNHSTKGFYYSPKIQYRNIQYQYSKFETDSNSNTQEIRVKRLKPDVSNMTGSFYFDAQFKLQDVKDDLDSRIDEYLKSLDYNGYLYKKKLDDVLQQVKGYIDMDLTEWQVTDAGMVWKDMGRRYQPASGYFRIFADLSQYINFIPVTDVYS